MGVISVLALLVVQQVIHGIHLQALHAAIQSIQQLAL